MFRKSLGGLGIQVEISNGWDGFGYSKIKLGQFKQSKSSFSIFIYAKGITIPNSNSFTLDLVNHRQLFDEALTSCVNLVFSETNQMRLNKIDGEIYSLLIAKSVQFVFYNFVHVQVNLPFFFCLLFSKCISWSLFQIDVFFFFF